jgi:hypothetical protein
MGAHGGPTLITSVQRAFRLLEVVSAHENGAPAKQLARETGLPLATAYHLLRTLVHDGYVRKLDDGGFILGARRSRTERRAAVQMATTAHLGRGAAGRRRSGRRRRRCAARAPALGSHVRRVRRVVLTPRELVVLADPVHADRTGGRHGVDTYSVPRARIEQVRADGPLLRIRVCEADLQLPLGEELSARVVHAFARHLPIAP